MACYHPLTALVTGVRADNGKKSLKVISKADSCYQHPLSEYIKLPCGNCIGCREDRAKTWAIRCVHEASLYEKNCFITLTYDNANLPKDGSLVKSHFQLFMKRLRKRYGNGIRYYQCGEYGEQFSRPHYHACLFNFDFPLKSKENPDGKYLWKETRGGSLFLCEALEKLWPYGFVSCGAVTFDSAAYVARYIVKKINGDLAPGHYQGRQPEYTTMSRRPGIAKDWFKKYKESDVALAYREGFITMNGKTYKIPKFYDLNYEITDPLLFKSVKETRQKKAKENPDNEPDRLAVRKTIHNARYQKLNRAYENQTLSRTILK